MLLDLLQIKTLCAFSPTVDTKFEKTKYDFPPNKIEPKHDQAVKKDAAFFCEHFGVPFE